MFRTVAFTLVAFGPLPLAAGAPTSDLVCDDSARLETQLSARHGAMRAGYGMRGPDALLEIWVSPTNGDWALVQTYSNGTSCIIALGEHWEETRHSRDPA